MRVAVVGGKLQGVEATYLAKKAGWEVVLIDKELMVPAMGMCDQFFQLDVTDGEALIPVLQGVDLVIPSTEDAEALTSLEQFGEQAGVPVAFDSCAYLVSSSKLVSNQLFAVLGIPTPIPWPRCGFPVIAKPSGASGSQGVVKIRDLHDFQCFAVSLGDYPDWVLEECLEGPSYSIEVIGFQGKYKVLQITELEMDSVFDCKRVLAPAFLRQDLVSQFEQLAINLAEKLNLNGIMDVEVILHNGKLKVLEIDARLPSQTPIGVYNSTGINMVEVLGNAFLNKANWWGFEVQEKRGVVFEHIKVTPGKIEVCGEHIMTEANCLGLYSGLFGADEVITDYMAGKPEWVATLIITAETRQQAWEKRCQIIKRLQSETGCRNYVDTLPAYNVSISNWGSL